MSVRFHVGPISFGLGRPKPYSEQEERENAVLGVLFVAGLLALGLLPVIGLLAAVALSGWLKDKGVKHPNFLSAAAYSLTTASWFLAFFLYARDLGLEAAARMDRKGFGADEFTQDMAIADFMAEGPGQVFSLAVASGITLVMVAGLAAGVVWVGRQLVGLAKSAWEAI